jgi:hypothetical protein
MKAPQPLTVGKQKLRVKKWNETESISLAVSMALENSEMFTDFCESQYPTQGKVLYKALARAHAQTIGVTYRSVQRTPEPAKERGELPAK